MRHVNETDKKIIDVLFNGYFNSTGLDTKRAFVNDSIETTFNKMFSVSKSKCVT